jgi:hypothetical protein
MRGFWRPGIGILFLLATTVFLPPSRRQTSLEFSNMRSTVRPQSTQRKGRPRRLGHKRNSPMEARRDWGKPPKPETENIAINRSISPAGPDLLRSLTDRLGPPMSPALQDETISDGD